MAQDDLRLQSWIRVKMIWLYLHLPPYLFPPLPCLTCLSTIFQPEVLGPEASELILILGALYFLFSLSGNFTLRSSWLHSHVSWEATSSKKPLLTMLFKITSSKFKPQFKSSLPYFINLFVNLYLLFTLLLSLPLRIWTPWNLGHCLSCPLCQFCT